MVTREPKGFLRNSVTMKLLSEVVALGVDQGEAMEIIRNLGGNNSRFFVFNLEPFEDSNPPE